MLKTIPTIFICLFVAVASSQFRNAQARQNKEEIMCKVKILESGQEMTLEVPRSEVVDYHTDPNLVVVGVNCRNEVERKNKASLLPETWSNASLDRCETSA